jgi:hypothetical protein
MGKVERDAVPTGLLAEFDLESGKIKNIQVFDFNLLKWESEADRKWK